MSRIVWTPELEQRLRALYPGTRTEDIAAALGLPLGKVRSKAWNLGLRKNPELVSQMARERSADPGHASHAHRWKKGQKPWNTGTQGLVGTHPNSRAYQFKHGNRPHSWVPVGSFRVRDGVLEVKFSEEPGAPNKRWRLYGTHVWIQAHGPVPAGHVVVFKPGRATVEPDRITLDAVELITRRELMDRNTCHRYPKALEQAIQLRGVLTRAINRAARKAAEKESAA